MKVELINENKVQITLSIDELSQRNLSLTDIEKDPKKARKLFLDLIEESNLQNDFQLEHTQVFVEATTDASNEFIVTITKIEDFPDLSKFDILNSEKNSSYSSYYSHFSIYEFSNLNSVIETSKILKDNKCFLGKNSLLKYNNKYFILFSKYSISNVKFTKTAALLNEYCNCMFEDGIFEISLKEKSKVIISDKAIQKLIKL